MRCASRFAFCLWVGRVGHLIFKKKMPESFAHERCLDHLMRNSMRKAPCRWLAKSCAKLLADGVAKFCAKLSKPISGNHCPTRRTRPTRPTLLSAKREAQNLALHCSLQSAKLCEMGLRAPCRGAPAVVVFDSVVKDQLWLCHWHPEGLGRIGGSAVISRCRQSQAPLVERW